MLSMQLERETTSNHRARSHYRNNAANHLCITLLKSVFSLSLSLFAFVLFVFAASLYVYIADDLAALFFHFSFLFKKV